MTTGVGVLGGFIHARGGGDRRPGAREGPDRQGGRDHRGQAATLHPAQQSAPAACEDAALRAPRSACKRPVAPETVARQAIDISPIQSM